MKDIQKESTKINRVVLVLSCLEWLLFFFTSGFIAAIILIFWKDMNTLSFFGWGLCFVWLLLTRAYKGMVNAYKQTNEELLDQLLEFWGLNKK